MIAPQKVSDDLGAEILRLWWLRLTTPANRRSPVILKRVVEMYGGSATLCVSFCQRLDFDPKKHLLPVEQ